MTYVIVAFVLLFIILLMFGTRRETNHNNDSIVHIIKQVDKNPFEICDFQKDLNTYLDLKSREFPIDLTGILSSNDRIRRLLDKSSKVNNSKFITEKYAIPANRIEIQENHLEIDFHEFILRQASDFFIEVCSFCERYEFDFVIIHGHVHGTAIKDMVNKYKGTFFKIAHSSTNPGITKFFAKTHTKDWISEFKKEEQDQINERIRQSREKVKDNKRMVGEKFDVLLDSYKSTNIDLLQYFLQTVNYDNQKYIFKIYSLLYNNLDVLQRDFIIKLLTSKCIFNHQPATECVVNKELLTIIFYAHAYQNFDIKCKNIESYELIAAQELGNLSFLIDYNLLAFIINNLTKSDEFDVELLNIMGRYSKLTKKQSQSICDVLSFIHSNIPTDVESQIEFSDDFVCFILIMGNFNPRFISYYKLDNQSPVQRIYYEKLLNNQYNVQCFKNLSTEQQQWYVEIKNKSKAFYQIPQKLIDKEFLEILYQDFPKIRELYGK